MPAGLDTESRKRRYLAEGWELVSADPGAYQNPRELEAARLQWSALPSRSTVAAALRASGQWTLDGPATSFDASDWWYRVRFPRPRSVAGDGWALGFDGLATVADVWLNGEPLLTASNMFVSYETDVTDKLSDENELVIRFTALESLLRARRPRPRWRAPMLQHQQLRWFRTSVLGRAPGWSPPVAPVGPWRPIWLEPRGGIRLSEPRLRTGLDREHGWLDVEIAIAGLPEGFEPCIVVSKGNASYRAALARNGADDTFSGTVDVPAVERWWPHTHGTPNLYEAVIELRSDSDCRSFPIGAVGFRDISIDTEDGGFAFIVNGEPIFCRGACWTPLDVVSLEASREALDAALDLVRAAGMNMLRVPGTTIYESAEFLELCDEKGILLWQDFMFANMDYPAADPDFVASVEAEVRQQLERLSPHPCLALLCGNSEVEQQAAMWGAPRDVWSPELFHKVIPEIVDGLCPDVPYWPSSAHGGSFPHTADAGTASYFGVGAYLRPPEDARLANVRFASECLAFANIPENESLRKMPNGASIRCHQPEWKARSPRDLGAGWDFDDVRDHYLCRLFGVDPLEIRYADHDRYLELGRIAAGEVMARAFSEWRRADSTCGGALVLFWRDLWLGAGWGIVDSLGCPKAPYYYLRRTLQPRAVFMTDEGGNGLYLHLVNELPEALEASVEVVAYAGNGNIVARAKRDVELNGRATMTLAAIELFDQFIDLGYAYRFGPASHELVVATLRDSAGTPLGESFHLVRGLSGTRRTDIGLAGSVVAETDLACEIEVSARSFAQSVWIEADGFVAEDAYFHLAPEGTRRIVVNRAPDSDKRPFRGKLRAANAAKPASIRPLGSDR